MSSRGLSGVLYALESAGRLPGWTVYRWRTPKARMIGLVPPGWAWDDANRQRLVNGVPV